MMILDHFEGDLAIVETDHGIRTVSIEFVDDAVCEGDVIFEAEDGMYYTDHQTTRLRQDTMSLMMKHLRNKCTNIR